MYLHATNTNRIANTQITTVARKNKISNNRKSTSRNKLVAVLVILGAINISSFKKFNLAATMEITTVKNGVSLEEQTVIEDSAEEASCLDEDESFFQDLEALLDHGVVAADIQKLKKAGVNTVKGVEMTTRKTLMVIQGFTEEKINAIKEACCKVSLTSGFLTALEVSDQRKQVFKISTGSASLE